MKTLTKLFLFLTMTWNFAHAQNLESSDLKNTLQRENLSSDDAYTAYEKLDALVQAKATTRPMKELLELCLLYAKHDESDAVYDLVYDLKKSNKKEFEKALKQLSKENRAKILDFIKMTEGEIKNGNG
jgi:hypothetical protein